MLPVLRTILPQRGFPVTKTLNRLWLNKTGNPWVVLPQALFHWSIESQNSVSNRGPWNHCNFPYLQICEDMFMQKRFYAKGKDKGKGSGKAVHSHITEDELAELINIEDLKDDLNGAIDHLKEEYMNNLLLRSSYGSLESLPVELDGKKLPLSEIAQVIRKTPTLVVINATAFPQATPNIKKSLLESNMNLNPQQDGTSFFIQIPKVTKEHRESLAKSAKAMCETAKSNMKDVQNKYIKKLKAKNGSVSEDLIFNAQIKIREMTQAVIAQADTLLKNKQNELLKTTK